MMPPRPELVAAAIMPDCSLRSHVAPLGLAFSTGSAPQKTYQGGVLVGEYGSWDRDPLNGYKMVYVPFENGTPSSKARDVVTGFVTDARAAHGWPVGLAIVSHGALLIADDAGGAVWRLTGARSQSRAGAAPNVG